MGFLSFYFVVLKTGFCEEEMTGGHSQFAWKKVGGGGVVCCYCCCFDGVGVGSLGSQSELCLRLCDHSVRICNFFFPPCLFCAERLWHWHECGCRPLTQSWRTCTLIGQSS